MKFVSTRGQTEAVSFSEAVAIGLAPDGGLFVPEQLPDLSDAFSKMEGLSYEETCYAFLKHFATDIDSDVLKGIIHKSYSKFDNELKAPLVKLKEGLWVLELFHGPTLAFKDFALQLLGNLYEHQIEETGRPINVLGATSGDTGAAAIHGLLGKKGVNIFILYPDGRVAPLQERQMVCTEADNVFPLAIEGSFDDAQHALKDVFGDQDFRNEVNLSAVNSINLARVLAQCVYYIYAFWQLPESVREKAVFVVPTGNFGNILAGWMAQQMGLPIKGFRVATNQNDILHRLFSTGVYEVNAVDPSLAPSMDIQVASNFERYLYFSLNGDSEKLRKVMSEFKETGRYKFESFDSNVFSSCRTDDVGIEKTISAVFEQFAYVADPHTACSLTDFDSDEIKVALSTAHPAKFPETIINCMGQHPMHPYLDELKSREIVKYKVDPEPAAIKAFIREKVSR